MNMPSQAIVPPLDNNKSSISGWPLMPSLMLAVFSRGCGRPSGSPPQRGQPLQARGDEWEPSAP